MPFASTFLGDIYYQSIGCGDPIVFLSGFSADHLVWASLFPYMQERYQLIVFDNPGCGRSVTPDGPCTMESMAQAAIELCDALSLERVNVVGSSMGGAIAQCMAYQYPDRVKKAVISNSFSQASHLSFPLFAEVRQRWFGKNIPIEDIAQLSVAWCFSGRYLTPENNTQLVKLFSLAAQEHTEKGYSKQLEAIRGFDSSSWLSDICVPCLFIASDEDAICFPSQIQHMVDQVPNGAYQLIEKAGHLPHIERPELFSRILFSFFANGRI